MFTFSYINTSIHHQYEPYSTVCMDNSFEVLIGIFQAFLFAAADAEVLTFSVRRVVKYYLNETRLNERQAPHAPLIKKIRN